MGRKSFSPVVVFAGLVMLAPGVGDIPGVPVLLGLIIILVATQMLLGRDHPWLPDWIERRSVRPKHVQKAVGWLRRPARWVDGWSRPRLTWAVRGAGMASIAVGCILVSALTPLMEVVPFSAGLAGLVITAFGVALIAQDGLIALISMVTAVGTVVLVLVKVL